MGNTNSEKNGRIEFIDPNRLFGKNSNVDNNTPDNISVNQEDLSMYVNLEVQIPRRNKVDNANNGFDSILSGSYVTTEEGETYNLLTDSFVNATYTEVKNGDKKNRELFGIKSIDVSFDAQFFPCVTMEFTDVRAFTLMGRAEEGYIQQMTNNKPSEAASDFFSAVFSFPYPLFKLNLKGFYGPLVSFDLSVSDFKSSFDASTGDFNVTIKFIGYMYGFYADLPASYVLCSPLFDFEGDVNDINEGDYTSINGSYWKQKIDDGTFRFPEYKPDGTIGNGSPIPTYIEFLSKYSALITPNQEKLKELGVSKSDLGNIQKYKEYSSEYAILDSAYASYEVYKNKIKAMGLPSIIDNHVIVKLSDEEIRDIKIGKNTELVGGIINSITKLNTKDKLCRDIAKSLEDAYVNNFKKVDEKDFFIEKINGVNSIKNQDLIKYYDNPIHEKIIESFSASDDRSFYIWKPQWEKDYQTGLKWSGITSITKETKDEIEEKIKGRIDEIDKKQAEIKDDTGKEILAQTEKILGFLPTVENMYRMIFAHLDTFAHHIRNTVDVIDNNDGKRTQMITDSNDYEFDFPKKSTVPPFPLVSEKKTDKNGKKHLTSIYPGDIESFSTQPEINLVEKIYNNIKLFRNKYIEASKEIELAEANTNGNDRNLSQIDYMPILYTDYFRDSSPYSKVFEHASDSKTKVNHLLGLLALRLMAYALCYETGCNDRTIGNIEAFNFFKSGYPKDALLLKQLSSITGGDFLDFLKSGKLKGDKIFEKPLLTKGGDYNTEFIKSSCNKKRIEGTAGDVLIDIDNINDVTTSNVNEITNETHRFGINCEYNEDSSEINECYGGKPNNMLTFYPLDDYHFDSIVKVMDDNWIIDDNEVGSGQKDKFFESYALNNIVAHEGGYFDEILQSKLKIKEYTNTIECAASFLMKYDKSFVNNPYKGPVGIKFTKISFVGTDSLITLIKRGCLLYTNIYNFNRYVYIEPQQRTPEQNEAFTEELIYKPSAADTYVEYVDNLKQLFIEWATGEIKYYGNILSNEICYPALVNFGTNTINTHNIDKLVKKNVITFKTIRSKDTPFDDWWLDSQSGDIKSLFERFRDRVISLYDFKDTDLTTQIVETNNTNKLESNFNNEIKKSIYYSLKTFYDKWFAGSDLNQFNLPKATDKNKYSNGNKNITTLPTHISDVKEYHRMEYVDSYLNDISNSMMIDMKSLRTIIDATLSENGSFSLFEVMHEMASRNRCIFLTVPVFYTNDIEELFKPKSLYGEKRIPGRSGSKYIVLFPGETSKFLNNSQNEDYSNDSFDIINYYVDGGVTTSAIDVFGEDGFVVKAFGVTYGMQNQNIFKSINIDMDTPTQTDYSIANTLMLANGGKNLDQNTAVFMNNSLYPIYANRSYTCKVELMGNVGLTPMMYFQLNNIPMFRGTYIITDVSHKIVPGDFTTTITGVRIPKYNIKPIDKVLSVDDFINRCGAGEGIGTNKKIVESGTTETNGGYQYKPSFLSTNNGEQSTTPPLKIAYTYDNISNIKDGTNRRAVKFAFNEKYKFDSCKESTRRLLYDLAYDIKNNSDFNNVLLYITSALREPKYQTSHHTFGFAIDIQCLNRSSNTVNMEYNRRLFNLVANSDKYMSIIDQIIWETHDTNGQKYGNTMHDNPYVIHISTCNVNEFTEEDKNNWKREYSFNDCPRSQIMQGFVENNEKTKILNNNRHNDVERAINRKK